MGKVDENNLPSDDELAAIAHNTALYLNCNKPDALDDMKEVILAAVREHEEWLMEEVCYGCGIARSNQVGWNQHGEHFATYHKCGNAIARAEWLRKQGGK